MQIEKSVDGVLGIQTCDISMVGADKTKDLWQPPKIYHKFRSVAKHRRKTESCNSSQ